MSKELEELLKDNCDRCGKGCTESRSMLCESYVYLNKAYELGTKQGKDTMSEDNVYRELRNLWGALRSIDHTGEYEGMCNGCEIHPNIDPQKRAELIEMHLRECSVRIVTKQGKVVCDEGELEKIIALSLSAWLVNDSPDKFGRTKSLCIAKAIATSNCFKIGG